MRELIGSSPYWPSRSEFEAAGLSGLEARLRTSGERERWTERLGLRVRPSGRPRSELSDTQAEAELRELVGEAGRMPWRHEFEAAGKRALYERLLRGRGLAYWAGRLGVEANPAHASAWNEQRIRAEMAEFCADRTDFPRQREFVEADRQTLMEAMKRTGGLQEWAGKLGLERKTVSAGVAKRSWTPELIESELRDYCRGRTHMPSFNEMWKDGRSDLAGAVQRYGGFDQWSKTLALPRRGRGKSQRWTEQRIESELRRLCAGRERFPAISELQRLAPSGLVAAIYRNGGADAWAERIGLPRSRRS